ncbi:hypothetical protein Tco_1116158 [Tanacetum coccineum]
MHHNMDMWKDEDYMEFDNIPSFWVTSKGDEEKGEAYVYQKRKTYYSDFLKLGPEYKRDEGVIRTLLFIDGSNTTNDGVILDKENPGGESGSS